MNIEINTNEYQFAHGKKPSGYGHWAFIPEDFGEKFWCEGKYSDAKREAIKYARARKVCRMFVATALAACAIFISAQTHAHPNHTCHQHATHSHCK